ncbi:MAG: SDR family oxidoreductase [Byssovorax sp.]
MAPSLDLHGKTALVTGASSGIGAALAEVLARDVGTLVLVARRRGRLDALAQDLVARHPSLKVQVEAVDLLDRAATAAMLDALEARGVTIDILVNNAGFGDRGLLDSRPWDKLEALLELNVVTLTYLIHRLLPGMLARGAGGILNIGSVAGIVSKPGSAVYGASKSFVNALGEALHAELDGTGVVVTTVLPGPVPTEFGALAMKDDAAPVRKPSSGFEQDEKRNPIQLPPVFVVSPEQCAEESVRALKHGQARLVPGGAVKVMAAVMDNLPRPIVRATLGAAAKRMRR